MLMNGAVRHFCTYFDKHYLSRGLALYHSIAAHHPAFRLYVCCMDEATRSYLEKLALPGLVPIGLEQLEAHDPELAAVRSTRTRVEYYFTSTAPWLRFIFQRYPEVELLTYVDADLRFFSSSEPALQEMGGASVAIVEHRFTPEFRHLEDRGRFNVGWLAFRRDEQGLAAIEWWRERCIEWCYDRLEGDRYADQKYLDKWPTLFEKLRVITHHGVNLAPWNLGGARVTLDGERVRVDGQPLICFHFHGLKHVAGPLYESGLRPYRLKLDSTLRGAIFTPYLQELARHEAELQRAGVTDGRAKSQRYMETPLDRWRARSTRLVSIVRLLASGSCLYAP